MKTSRTVFSVLLTLLLAVSPLFSLSAEGGAQVGGYLFMDGNGDGLPASGDKRADNVEVTLMRVTGGAEHPAAQMTTGADGAYRFIGLEAGQYYVEARFPAKHLPTKYMEGGSFALPGTGSSARTPVFSLEDGQSFDNVLLGAVKKSAGLKIIAFGDENANSGRFSSEPLLKNVQIELIFDLNGMEYVVASTTTNKNGEASISGFTPGTYRVAATLPDPYIVGPVGKKISLFYNGIIPSGDSRGLSRPIDFSAGNTVGMGVGGVMTGKAEGFVWQDTNADGKRQAAEPGAAGVSIKLYHPSLGLVRESVTGADGGYLFERLEEGTYRLEAALPEGVMFTLPGESLFSDGFSASASESIQVTLGKTTSIAPIGTLPASSVTVSAFNDSDGNGVKDDSEPAFAGAKVRLMKGGKPAAEGVTDISGSLLFPIVRAGGLTVEASLPQGQIFSVKAEGGNAFSAPATNSAAAVETNVPTGGQASLLLGVTLPASVSGAVYDDGDLSGTRNDQEKGVAGLKVSAVGADGASCAQTVTDNNGAYTLSPLVPGEYTVRVEPVSPYIFSSPAQTGAKSDNKIITQTPVYGETASISVKPGDDIRDIDAAVFRSATVSGKVMLGDESDGFTGAMGGFSGVRLSLLDENLSPVSDYTVAETDADGAFLLKGALPGTYRLSYTLPDGAAFSRPMQDEKNYVSEPFELKSSDSAEAETLFAVKTCEVSGTVFEDGDFDGVFSPKESGLAGVSLTMQSGGRVFNAVTSENGGYVFRDLRPGTYTTEITLPENMLVYHTADAFAPEALKNTSSGSLTLQMGEQKRNKNAAAAPQTMLSLNIFYDNDLSGARSEGDLPYPAGSITLTHALTGTEISAAPDENGVFTLPTAYPGAYTFSLSLPDDHTLFAPKEAKEEAGLWRGAFSAPAGQAELSLSVVQFGGISGAVWNLDGSKNSLSALPVVLIDASTGKTAAQTATGKDGGYAFSRLYPGEYRLGFSIPAGYRYAREMDTAARKSIVTAQMDTVRGESGRSEVISLSMGENLPAMDVGMGAVGTLGDLAWLDLDGDGMQDTGEPGVPGLTIEMYQYGQLAAQTVTDEYGRYFFDALYPGEYTLRVQLPKELSTTKVQDEFPLLANVLPAGQKETAEVSGIIVPSGGRNLNCDLGFTLISPGRYPDSMRALPQKDWTPLVPYTPTR